MPRIYDNINLKLQDGLKEVLANATHADFCVGYFNLRGWDILAPLVQNLPGYLINESGQVETRYCRLLIGMQKLPIETLKEQYSRRGYYGMDGRTAMELKKKMALQFREQLMIGRQSNQEEEVFKDLLRALKSKKLQVKLYLKELLHAKLYIAYRKDYVSPVVGYVGSSNLTFAGLKEQCELNLDVVDEDAGLKLAAWFQDRWDETFCLDITDELINALEESWISEHSPYQIYLKILYHLSQEAREGITEFAIPKEFKEELLDFQVQAVQRAARLLNTKGGVMIGDVVGLGKTMIASALAKIFEDNHRILIICPAGLVSMWKWYKDEYNIPAEILSIGVVIEELPKLRPYNFVIIDESHNLRNSNSKRYQVIKNYITELKNPKVVLLTATPYNKSLLDISNQLKLFVSSDEDLGIAPERYIEEIGGRTQFYAKHNVRATTINAFEHSKHEDDWRELTRLYLVRRTRKFIKENFAHLDHTTNSKYLLFPSGERQYFPARKALKVEYTLKEDDQYARLYSDTVVGLINDLDLPRYGLGLDEYLATNPIPEPTKAEREIKANLGKAGARMVGFARTNLFKRLESSGHAFLLSLKRHLFRNELFLYAIENGLALPIAQAGLNALDDYFEDQDLDEGETITSTTTLAKFYEELRNKKDKNAKWLGSHVFNPRLKISLEKDCQKLREILKLVPEWKSDEDQQLTALKQLLTQKHPNDKVLIFTQFADTAQYLGEALEAAGITKYAVVTGKHSDPKEAAVKFSPISNKEQIAPEKQTRILIATDVLSEGQNLQDAHIILNYDLPWAIIRIIQRAGRVDRIGQKSKEILCYSFLPASGIEKIIKLRSRLKHRLEQSDSLLGAPDEIFFEDQKVRHDLEAIYSQNSNILEQDEGQVDLASEALALWKKEEEINPAITKKVATLPNVIYSAMQNRESKVKDGLVLFTQPHPDTDMLLWLNKQGNVITTSQTEILRAIKCEHDEPTLRRAENHHDLVDAGMKLVFETLSREGGQLGRPSSARYKLYYKLKSYLESKKPITFDLELLKHLQQAIYDAPLKEFAKDSLNRQLTAKASDEEIINLAIKFYEEGKLTHKIEDQADKPEPQVICSLGLIS